MDSVAVVALEKVVDVVADVAYSVVSLAHFAAVVVADVVVTNPSVLH